MKARETPPELRSFIKLFNDVAYSHDQATVFSDFVEYCLCCFTIEDTTEFSESLKAKYGKRYLFPELFREYIIAVNSKLTDDKSWYDGLGHIYEVVASSSKKSNMGQFFTPPTVCDFMAQLSGPQEGQTGLHVEDCACGSGRMLLAAHVQAPGNYMYGSDLDWICVRMAAVNMCMHGIRGQVCHTNSLTVDDWYAGWHINPWQHMVGPIPHIVTMKGKHESRTWQHWQQQLKAKEQGEVVEQPQQPTTPIIVHSTGYGTQATLF